MDARSRAGIVMPGTGRGRTGLVPGGRPMASLFLPPKTTQAALMLRRDDAMLICVNVFVTLLV
jgi:hypothetical protein